MQIRGQLFSLLDFFFTLLTFAVRNGKQNTVKKQSKETQPAGYGGGVATMNRAVTTC